MTILKDHFFEISTKLPQNQSVSVAKNIKIQYDFIMHGDGKHFYVF